MSAHFDWLADLEEEPFYTIFSWNLDFRKANLGIFKFFCAKMSISETIVQTTNNAKLLTYVGQQVFVT